MKQNYWLLFFSTILIRMSTAQIDQPSVGPGYIFQSFYALADGSTTQRPYTGWDIAFGVGGQDPAIFVNEAVGISRTGELPILELFLTESTDFTAVDTTGMQRVYNDERSWDAGAFNRIKNSSDPFDFGWGSYNPITHNVNGTRIFVLKLRSGEYKKIQIQLLSEGTYTFQYADLDGRNEEIKTLNKADHAGKTLAYFSFALGAAVDIEPDHWDLVFARYATPLNAGMGDTLEYLVTGILTNRNVEVAKVTGIDPVDVDFADYEELLNADSLTNIGHDWKEFDLNSFQWVIPTDRVYFVKTADNSLWKVQFLDFEGSSTGVSTLEKTFAGMLTSTAEFKNLQSFEVFPNPASGSFNISLELQGLSKRQEGLLRLTSTAGQVIHSYRIQMQEGLNVHRVAADQIPAGLYNLSLYTEGKVITRSLVINN